MPDGTGGYVLDGWGGLHPFGLGNGTAPPAATGGSTGTAGTSPAALALLPDGTGGYVLDGWGGLHPFAIGNHPAPPAASAGVLDGLGHRPRRLDHARRHRRLRRSTGSAACTRSRSATIR